MQFPEAVIQIDYVIDGQLGIIFFEVIFRFDDELDKLLSYLKILHYLSSLLIIFCVTEPRVEDIKIHFYRFFYLGLKSCKISLSLPCFGSS